MSGRNFKCRDLPTAWQSIHKAGRSSRSTGYAQRRNKDVKTIEKIKTTREVRQENILRTVPSEQQERQEIEKHSRMLARVKGILRSQIPNSTSRKNRISTAECSRSRSQPGGIRREGSIFREDSVDIEGR